MSQKIYFHSSLPLKDTVQITELALKGVQEEVSETFPYLQRLFNTQNDPKVVVKKTNLGTDAPELAARCYRNGILFATFSN
ncbi:MAG: hypothetical protein RMM17_06505 [Acidobacteriota bacterium]|nr:hypothetical protein [Blastocatellia bacterium]MDW8412315.1 hypothetical protein [Acidobacteriota bacterium]